MRRQSDSLSASMSPRSGSGLIRMLKWTTLTLIAVGAVLVEATVLPGGFSKVLGLASWLVQFRPYAICLHVTLIALLWAKWSTLVNYLFARGKVHPSNKEAVLASRNRTVMLLLAVELFVVIGFPFTLVR